jgi:hypothetical protein
MARGWESKSVEMQIEELGSGRNNAQQRPAPPENAAANTAQRRELELLELSRRRLLAELEAVGDMGDHRFRAVKRRALAHVEAAIAAKQSPPG